MELSKIDKNMAILCNLNEALDWQDVLDGNFSVYGFPFTLEEKKFNRLSSRMREEMLEINEGLVFLASNTAGGQIHFKTASPEIQIYVKLSGKSNMCHMPATGQCGFDCYFYNEEADKYIFRSCTTYDANLLEYGYTLFTTETEKNNKFILNMPLYSGVEKVMIGVKKGYKIQKSTFENPDRVVVYGTSIVQGACASRPGMAHTNIIARKLDREVINFGFSGVAFAEPLMGSILGEIERQSLLIVDVEPNAGIDDRLKDNLEKFILQYRKKQPKIPILLVSRIPFAMDNYDDNRRKLNDFYKKFLKEYAINASAKGDNKIYFCDGSEFFADDKYEYTVDGIHPTDYGFAAIADGYLNAIRKILK